MIGGALAAGAGFGLARYLPDGWPMPDIKTLELQLAAQTATVELLKAQLADLAARPVPDVEAGIAALKSEIDAKLAATVVDPAPAIAEARSRLEASLAEIDSRLVLIEKRPAAGGAASESAVAAFERDLQALRTDVEARLSQSTNATADIQAIAAEARAQVEAATAQANALKTEAEAAVRATTARAALSRVQAAMEGGGPYAAALADLADSGVEIPAVLTDSGETGVPTLTDLQHSFPAAARAALDEGLKATVGDGWADRLTSFLQSETGARSLQPREGTDADAILSRAEAALNDGQIGPALAELSALPEAAKAPMTDWLAAATLRVSAVEAVATLTAAMDAK